MQIKHGKTILPATIAHLLAKATRRHLALLAENGQIGIFRAVLDWRRWFSFPAMLDNGNDNLIDLLLHNGLRVPSGCEGVIVLDMATGMEEREESERPGGERRIMNHRIRRRIRPWWRLMCGGGYFCRRATF